MALRAAVTARLKTAVATGHNRSLSELLRQFAYDRLLYRVFTSDDRERWVLKGATALLTRLLGQARHSVDIDLYDQSGTLDAAEAALREAAEREVGDHFRFVLAPGVRIAEGGVALRVNVIAFLGVTQFAQFNVDLVAGTGMTGTPEEADALVSVDLPGVARTTYRVYPLADHVADKVLAIIERHVRLDGVEVSSTRYRDLVDLVVIARREAVYAEALREALTVQGERRGIELPREFQPPDTVAWRAGYARVARDVMDLEEMEFDAAVETVRAFIDPVLQDSAGGRWSPDEQAWVDG